MQLDRLKGFFDSHHFVFKEIKEKRDINKFKMPFNNLQLTQSAVSLMNMIYRSFSGCRHFSKKEFTPSGGLSICGVELFGAYYWCRNNVKGFEDLKTIVSFEIYIYVGGRLYAFVCGQPRAELTHTGGVAVRKLLKCAKEVNFDLTKFREDNIDKAMDIKKSIQKPLISCLYPILPLEYGGVNGVCHLDLNESYRGSLESKYPEFKVLFAEVDKEFPDHKENKDIINMSIGMFQSKYMGFAYSSLSKTAIDGTRQRILDISKDLLRRGYLILGYNTDGIWYKASDSSIPSVYHGKGEGSKAGQFKTDYTDCFFIPMTQGGNWVVTKGKKKGKEGFFKALRGNFEYARTKEYEDWDSWDDISKAVTTEEVTTIFFDEDKGWRLTTERIYPDGYHLPKPVDATLNVLVNRRTLKYV